MLRLTLVAAVFLMSTSLASAGAAGDVQDPWARPCAGKFPFTDAGRAGCAALVERIRQASEDISERSREDDWSGAIRVIDAAKKIYDDPWYDHARGFYDEKLGDYEQAVRDYSAAINAVPLDEGIDSSTSTARRCSASSAGSSP